ncbi:uncharacterized protein BYT42DRAFT_581522 [Radiomyces spectabilis]|uniref:uncharacterized protein n=1 Tax=Radiomyces spectabilis TaxID=64574 RepID=UPI002220AA83|nr:uncharacterized protein BYT42DRAFT_581522 [Radiomyces spectabilis]KAI8371772.1 hypothetical protein BYT42DRAFT_581522 [Radiomyces spectabilis]
MALEKRFSDFTKVVERFYKDAQTFRDAISSVLMHQAAMAGFLATIYDTHIGKEIPEGAIQKRVQQTPAASLQAANDAEAAMAYCRDEILPELDAVDRDIVRPLLELLEIMRVIQKTIVKRNHKLIDYDRHRASLNKLKGKDERSFNEEKQIFKVEAQLQTATDDYQYLNVMLKQQLPQFFQLKTQFVQPVFEHFYNLQTKIYGMIYARCYELLNANADYFVTSQMGIEDGYNWKKSQRDVRAEMENMDLLRSGGKTWLAASGGANNSKLSLKERAALRNQEGGEGLPPPAYGSPNGGVTLVSTPMGYPKDSWQQSPHFQQQQQYQNQAGPASPPPPPPIANRQPADYVIALYDYTAQADGDLTFKKNDRIEVVERTADQNDWWTGRLNGVTGIFPGNYVANA